jgi:molybdopterin-containing oxidoreductase family membrane subunit
MNFMLFVRFLPVIAIAEVKGVLPKSDPHYRGTDPRTVREDEIESAPSEPAPARLPEPLTA